jgi:GWxTD domain-containing protein
MKQYIIITILLFLTSCFNNRKTANNFAYQYQNRTMNQQIEYKLYKLANDSTLVYLQIPTQDFLPNANNQWHLMLNYQWYDLDKPKTPIGTATTQFKVAHSNSTKITLQYTCKLPLNNNYRLHVFVQDQNGTKLLRNKWVINATESKHNYLLTDLNNKPLFDKYVKENTIFRLQYQQQNTTQWQVLYYKSIKNLALPPFMEQSNHYPNTPDSSFITNNPVALYQTGTYLFTPINEPNTPPFVLVCTDDNFPKLTSATDLATVTRYITKNEEYNQLINSPNIKLAIDDFWLKHAGSTDRGKLLIKEYYGRVQRANQLFTTYKEGWKTDQGLIYIIYGEPNAVWIDKGTEIWQYTSSARGNLFFSFALKNTPFDKQYFLERSATYDVNWHDAVFEWRKGIIANNN